MITQLGTAGLTLALALTVGCSEPAARPVSFTAFGFETVAPPGWRYADGEMTNHRSYFSLRTEDLDGADPAFLAGLPESIEPELANWTRNDFGSPTPGGRADVTLSGLPALRVDFSASVRSGRATTQLRYWILHRGERLYLFRAVFPAGRFERDAPAVDAIVAAIRFAPLPKSETSVTLR